MSEYARQLREKQKVKRIYGLSESQFRNTFERATAEQGVSARQLARALDLGSYETAWTMLHRFRRAMVRSPWQPA